MEYINNQYHIFDQRSKVQLDQVEALLRNSYWASTRSRETMQTAIDNSVCFSLYRANQQIGFARVVTDFATVAYLADVIIAPAFRGKGLGKWLTEVIANDPRWQDKLQILATDDAHGLYQRLGYRTSDQLMSTQVTANRTD